MARAHATPTGSAHDHDRCVADALATAEAVCQRSGARLTELRRRVLELVWGSHTPVGAYDLLGALARGGRAAAPPTVYRALDFLLEQGLIHRIASLNAFVGCAHPEAAHAGHFLICLGCREVSEFDDRGLSDEIAARAARRGFEVRGQAVEVTGLCSRCRAAGG